MKFPTGLNFLSALAFSVSVVAATPIVEVGHDHAPNLPRDASCSKSSIDQCAVATGAASTACFGHLCAGRTLSITKRQDSCTEENLLECTGEQWQQAQLCFEQLCL
ncbi:hypothetical protein F4780DRAFT_784429 [Xylariomycetidae sp. FL0641]|nr:hypothetical protein F4780DRAFT_784429 [Xylariomycetidae sp. FL0641]